MKWKCFNPPRWLRKPPSRYTKEEALRIAHHFGLVREVRMALAHGCTPDEALQEWDIYPLTEAQFNEWII